jgi:hypothetical protein
MVVVVVVDQWPELWPVKRHRQPSCHWTSAAMDVVVVNRWHDYVHVK